VTGPNGLTYWQPSIAESATGCTRNVLDGPLEDFGDNKVLADAGGAFDPSFAPAADSFELGPQRFLTFPRPNDAFTDLLGRNHTCGNYGLTEGVCAGNAGGSPEINILDTGDLVAGVQNYAAMLHGFGEFEANADGSPVLVDGQPQRPTEPYGVLCERCGGRPYVPIAEFYVDNSLTDPADQSVTQVMAGGSYGVLGSADQYTATVDPAASGDFKLEVIPEEDPGGAPARQQLGTSATGEFSNLTVVSEGDPGYDGINGGDHIEFDLTIENTSSNPDAYLTAFNYQTKRRGLADIGILDGFTQDRRDVRAADPATFPGVLETCGDDPEQGACWDSTLGIGRFPNVVGNGLLFGQMVWPDADAGREPEPVIPDQVHVDAVSGRTPEPYWLESVKKNGPFAPILQGNSNFICVKSGLFDQDPDADAACGGEPAILTDPTGEPIPGNIATRPGIPARGEPAEVPARLGLPPGEEQTVRIRMEFGDFRGVLLELLPGTLTVGNLARNFDCSDQRELEYCHPELVGQNIGYNPNTSATWLTPANLADVNHVIINQPGDAPTVMNFVEHFGEIMSMADFVPSAEFHAPDTNPELANFCPDGSAAWCSLAEGGMSNVLIRQQVIGQYVPDFAGLGIDTVEPAVEIDSPVDGSSFIRGEQIPGRYRCTDELGGVGVNNTRGCVAPVPAGAPIDTSAGGDYDFTVTATDRAGNGPVELTHSYSVCQHEFNDVRPAFTGGVDWASCLNHMAGFGSEFRADAGITRGAFARLLYSVAGRPDVSGLPPHGLTGVPASLSDAVTWLVANGYDTGFPDGSFRRLQVVRRGHLARVLHLVAGSPEASAPNTFSDVPNRLDDAVSWLTDPANSPRYANGFANGTFRPAQVINRGNTVRVVCRINGPPGLC
jgi:hypothetical protein